MHIKKLNFIGRGPIVANSNIQGIDLSKNTVG
jgi:hypothetical protein